MQEVISKELLREVLKDKKIEFVDIRDNQIWFAKTEKGAMAWTWSDICINIHELAHKCKEWADGYGYTLKSFTADNYQGVSNGCCEFYYERTGKKVKDLKDVCEQSEPEAIFKACQWILDDKDNK